MNRDHVSETIRRLRLYINEVQTKRENLQGATDRNAKEQAKRRLLLACENLAEELHTESEHIIVYNFADASKTLDANAVRALWQKRMVNLGWQWPDRLPMGEADQLERVIQAPDHTALTLLPQRSFWLQFRFTLETPYLSKNDHPFHLIPVPLRSDLVLGRPYVPPSSWKGCLRAAYRKTAGTNEVAKQSETRLFGNEKEGDTGDNHNSGRLQLFPTFFKDRSLEVINPHDRRSGAGQRPVFIESAKIMNKGLYTLLYVSDGRDREDGRNSAHDAEIDLVMLAEALPAMFLDYGFGAKTSSGFGRAKEEFTGGCFRMETPPIEKNSTHLPPFIVNLGLRPKN